MRLIVIVCIYGEVYNVFNSFPTIDGNFVHLWDKPFPLNFDLNSVIVPSTEYTMVAHNVFFTIKNKMIVWLSFVFSIPFYSVILLLFSTLSSANHL